MNSEPFQRLRRIRQLAFSEFVYPGAGHSRFEHSLGVMHLVTKVFDRMREKRNVRDLLESSEGLGYDLSMWDCARATLRIAALVHDLGHMPFSHAGEIEWEDSCGRKNKIKHEFFTYSIVRKYLPEILDNHPENASLNINADDIANFLEGKIINQRLTKLRPWRELLVGEFDCDRMDYLLRDSYHLGVDYGRFDLERVTSSLTLVRHPDRGDIIFALEEDGLLAIESLILARYYMYKQVYFHKVRRYLDRVYGDLLPKIVTKHFGHVDFASNLEKYLDFDDWVVNCYLKELASEGDRDAKKLIRRECWKVIYEITSITELNKLTEAKSILKEKGIESLLDSFENQRTHKFQQSEIMVVEQNKEIKPLKEASEIVTKLPEIIFVGRLYGSGKDRKRILNERLLQNFYDTSNQETKR